MLLLVFKMVKSFWKAFWQFLIKSNIHLSYYPTIPPFNIYSKEMKTFITNKNYIRMFISPLITMFKFETTQSPSTRKGINKLWQIRTRNTIQQWQGMNDWSMQQSGWISKAVWVKEYRPKERILNDSFYMKFKKRQNNWVVIGTRTVVAYGKGGLPGRGHKKIF